MPDGSVTSIKDPVPFPWHNGFEDGFCGYANAKGYCYKHPAASYEVVEAPVHSGQHAARFTVTADDSVDGNQTRCVREGAMPTDAVYGAWFFLSAAVSGGNWNLMFFNGGNADGLDSLPGGGAEWDVSLGSEDGGALTLHILDHCRRSPDATDAGTPPPRPTVPLGEWFHVEFRFRRAQDATGRVTLYQDGKVVEDITDLQTELTGVTWGQWSVGNLVGNVTPPESTLYVDDVSLAPPPP
jgi:hypothetical protein